MGKVKFVMDEVYEVTNPWMGYTGYLLRTRGDKLSENEHGSDSILVLDPEKRTGRLSDDISERVKIRRSWNAPIKEGKRYICVNFTAQEDMPVRELKEAVWIRNGKLMIEKARRLFPSFEPFCAVWHTFQVNEDTYGEYTRPAHLHILMKKVKPRTTEAERMRMDRWNVN